MSLDLLKVAGVESVTVPAGTFDTFKVDVKASDGGPEKSTVWIDVISKTGFKAEPTKEKK